MTISVNLKKYSLILLFALNACIIAYYVNSGYAIIGAEILLILLCIYFHDENAVICFMILNVAQNIVLCILSYRISAFDTKMIIIIKESMIYVLSTILILEKITKKTFKHYDVLAVMFIIYCGMHFIVSPNMASIASLRQFSIPFACFYFGQSIKITEDGDKRIEKSLINISFIVCFIGLYIYYFTNDEFWIRIGYRQFMKNKTQLESASFNNFYTFDLMRMVGTRLKRFVSIFADPLAAAHFLTAIATILFVKYNHKNTESVLTKILIVTCIILCFSKSHIVLIAVAIFLLLFIKLKSKKNQMVLLMLCACISLIFFWMISVYVSKNGVSAIGNHFASFIQGIKTASFLGNGIGTSGWNAKIYAGLVDKTNTSESLFAMIMYQMGIVGTVLFYGFIISIIWVSMKYYKCNGNKDWLVSITLLLSFAIESIVSASSLSMLGTGIYFVMSGYYLKYNFIINVQNSNQDNNFTFVKYMNKQSENNKRFRQNGGIYGKCNRR